MSTIVTTQAELDAALADKSTRSILINSSRGVWINIGPTNGKEVSVGATATIGTISGTVERVDSGGTVERVDSGGTVKWVYSGGTVKWVYSGGTVERVDSGGTVKWVYSGGTVERVDSGGTVERATGSAVIHLYGGQLAKGGSSVAVFIHTASVAVDGGTIIDLTEIDLHDVHQWADFNGTEIIDGRVILYKAVDKELLSGRGFTYPISGPVTAPDWRDDNACGGGLHFGPSPIDAQFYHTTAKRFLRASAAIEDVRPINEGDAPKVKVRTATILAEVDLNGDELAGGVS